MDPVCYNELRDRLHITAVSPLRAYPKTVRNVMMAQAKCNIAR